MSLEGSILTKGNSIIDPKGHIFIKPSPHTYGTSRVQFQVSDLAYFEAWGNLEKIAVLDNVERDLVIVGKRL